MHANRLEPSKSPAKNEKHQKHTRSELKTNHYPFLSDPQRFHYQYPDNPGPGSYEQKDRERHTSDYHIARENNPWAVGKEHLWILSKGRGLFQTNNAWKYNIGPGKYVNQPSKPKDSSGWGKNPRFNYKKAEEPVDLGPGSYALSRDLLSQRPVASSAFNSKSTKSYIEEVVSQQAKLHESKDNPELPFQQIEEEEEEDNEIVLPPNNKKHGSPVFLSKIERLPKTEPGEVGPGSYTLSSPLGREKRRRLQTETNQEQFRQSLMQKHHSSKIIGPGPGAYDISSSANKSPIRRSPLGIILKERRFKSSSLNDSGQTKYYDTTGKTASLGGDKLLSTSKLAGCESGLGSVYSLLKQVQKQRDRQSRALLADR